MEQPSAGYNIFARELSLALEAHGARLGQLNDNPDLKLHPQLVRRLQISLTHTKPLVTLNPEDLEKVTKVYTMSEEEITRLKAAVLATSVERVLMDRIENSTALMAANAVFRILREAFQNDPDLMQVRGSTPFLPPVPQPDAGTMELALDTYDSAMLELYLTGNTTPSQRASQAHQTLAMFLAALEQLEQCSATEKQSEDWQFWYHEAARARDQAKALLDGGK